MDRLLRELRSGLRRGDAAEAKRVAGALRSSGSRGLALFAAALAAERARDARTMRRVLASPDLLLLRRFPARLAEVATAAVWTVGVSSCERVLALACTSPPRPRERSRLLAAFHALARRTATLEVARVARSKPTPARLLPDVRVPLVRARLTPGYADWFLFDTGAPTTVISARRADRGAVERLLPLRSARDASGREVLAQPALVASIEIGGVALKGCTADVMELHPRLEVGGILSPWDTLRGFAIELDFRRRLLRLEAGLTPEAWRRRTGETVHTVPLTWDDGNPFVAARVAGHPVWLLFNTGAGENVVSPRFTRFAGFVPGPPRATFGARHSFTVGAGFGAPVVVGEAGSRELPFVVADLHRGGRFASLDAEGSLGTRWMEGRRILLAADGATVSFTEVKPRRTPSARGS